MEIKQKGELTWKAINSPKLDGKIKQSSSNQPSKYNWNSLYQFGDMTMYGQSQSQFPLIYQDLNASTVGNYNFGAGTQNKNTNTGTNTGKYNTSTTPPQPALEINLGGRRTDQGWERRITEATDQGKARKAAKLKKKYLKWDARQEKQAARIDGGKDFDAAKQEVKDLKKPFFGKHPSKLKTAVKDLKIDKISDWEKK